MGWQLQAWRFPPFTKPLMAQEEVHMRFGASLIIAWILDRYGART